MHAPISSILRKIAIHNNRSISTLTTTKQSLIQSRSSKVRSINPIRNWWSLGCTTTLILSSGSFGFGFGPSPISALTTRPAFTTLVPFGRRSVTTVTATSTSATRMEGSSTTTLLDFDPPNEGAEYDATIFIGKKCHLETLLESHNASEDTDISPFKTSLSALLNLPRENVNMDILKAALNSIKGKSGSVTTYLPQRISFCTLPKTVSRNNHPLSVHTVTDLVASACSAKRSRVIFVGVEAEDVGPLASAVAKSFPLYSSKSSSSSPKQNDGESDNESEKEDSQRFVQVSFLNILQQTTDETTSITLSLISNPSKLAAATAVAEGVRLAARLVDMPPAELTTEAYANECRRIVTQDLSAANVTMTEIVGQDLQQKGYGGIYGVGQAAVSPPRMVILEYTPNEYTNDDNNNNNSNNNKTMESIALVGKGIVYDTGGLSLKTKTGMCGMKHDMGGSAGVLGGFYAAVKLRTPHKITLILCLAENAIGPNAFRNDDILTLYSGKTVEINNCDAEGRLVLGDGVAHATQHISGLDWVLDMATLTGAQLVTTGKKHAGILANTVEMEERAVKAGMHSGDLCYPMLYAPDLLKAEFASKVADMKNSVKDRGNAQASCAGHFIEAHLKEEYRGGWIHVDMAGPATKAERGTGYGVGLVLSLLNAPGF